MYFVSCGFVVCIPSPLCTLRTFLLLGARRHIFRLLGFGSSYLCIPSQVCKIPTLFLGLRSFYVPRRVFVIIVILVNKHESRHVLAGYVYSERCNFHVGMELWHKVEHPYPLHPHPHLGKGAPLSFIYVGRGDIVFNLFDTIDGQ